MTKFEKNLSSSVFFQGSDLKNSIMKLYRFGA